MPARKLPRLLGVREIADELGVTKQAVNQAVRRGTFPPPVQVLACGPIWTEDALTTWRKRREPVK